MKITVAGVVKEVKDNFRTDCTGKCRNTGIRNRFSK